MTFEKDFTATLDHIDELGHVNNAVWVQWVQDLSVSHWQAVAPADQQAAYIWVVTRHAIDYRGNMGLGETARGSTWITEAPRGARFDRHWRFTGEDGRVKVEGTSTWAMLDRATGRLVRVRADIAAPFLDAAAP